MPSPDPGYRMTLEAHPLRHGSELVEGEADPKPYKVYRLTTGGDLSPCEAEYATKAEAVDHVNLGGRYRIVKGRVQVWPPPR